MMELLKTSPQDQQKRNRLSTVGAASPSIADHLGANTLTGSAAKLFSILSQLKKNIHTYRPDTLHDYLANELKKFAQQTHDAGYQDEQILLSQYILCYTFDQTIAQSTAGYHQTWRNFSLMNTLPHANSIEQNFKTALTKMCQLPDKFIDILELIYICLNLTGPHQQLTNSLNWQAPENLTALYDVIQHQRGEFEKRLSKPVQPNASNYAKRERNFFTPLFMFGAILIMIGSYFSFDYLTHQTSQPIEKELSTLVQTTYNSQ